MNRGKTRCHWCPKLYTSPGAYSTHLKKVHPEMNFKSTGKPKRRFSYISDLSTSGLGLDPDLDKPGSPERCSNQNPVTSPPHLDLKTLRAIVSQDYGSSDIEYESDRSDREARSFTSDPEPNGDGQPSDSLDLRARAGIAIRKYSFPEENPSFNLYAPFRNHIDYQLAQFFSSSKISSAKINKFFKDRILNDLNPTYMVQFRSAHTLHKLRDATVNESSWYSGKVNYPLQKGVKFRYRKLISVVKYLLRNPHTRATGKGPLLKLGNHDVPRDLDYTIIELATATTRLANFLGRGDEAISNFSASPSATPRDVALGAGLRAASICQRGLRAANPWHHVIATRD